MVYKWKDGARISGNADAIAREINALGARVEPRAVVDAARDESAELHKCFEWDDGIAAEAYRVEQARGIIQALVVVEEVEHGLPEKVTYRAYESVEVDGGTKRAYVPTKTALVQPDLRSQVIARLKSTISTASDTLDMYQHLVPEIRPIRKHINRAVTSIQQIAASVT